MEEHYHDGKSFDGMTKVQDRHSSNAFFATLVCSLLRSLASLSQGPIKWALALSALREYHSGNPYVLYNFKEDFCLQRRTDYCVVQ
jgi:hypothetical protein